MQGANHVQLFKFNLTSPSKWKD